MGPYAMAGANEIRITTDKSVSRLAVVMYTLLIQANVKNILENYYTKQKIKACMMKNREKPFTVFTPVNGL
jgi:hypothetical protein